LILQSELAKLTTRSRKGSLIPAVSLFLTEIEYRQVPVSNVEPDSFEVVIRDG
jgi:hypothetical protein